jgi:anthranilate phosphoribosyltransferase
MRERLQKLLMGTDLSREEAREMILWMMSEDAVPTQTAAMLALQQAKGISVEEIVGAAQAMRERSDQIQAPEEAIDTCSTGGNGISTFNISTCAAIIASARGAVVAKHGNRTNTRKSGSAEALQALGVNIEMDLPHVEQCLRELKLCFCYAMKHHPAMRFAGPIRKELGIPTIFNLLGPLTNPAGVKRQLIGVHGVEWTFKIAQSLAELGAVRALVVHGADGLCELTTTAKTHVAELKDGRIELYELEAGDVGLPAGDLDEMRITAPEQSAQLIREILQGENQNTARHVALYNAAGALVVAGKAETLQAGVQQATEIVDSGQAWAHLQRFANYTQEV